MTHRNDTARPFSSDEARSRIKQIFALAQASFPDATFEQLGVWLDESASTIKAWVDAKRQHCPPMWAIVRLRQKHPAMAAYIDLAMDAMVRENDSRPVAHTLEAQTFALIGSTSRVLEHHAESMKGDMRFDSNEAQRFISVLTAHRETIDRTIGSAQERAGIVGLRRAQ